MYLELEMPMNDNGDIKLIADTSNASPSITLTLITKDGELTLEDVDICKLGQFVVNTRRLLTMAHEDTVMTDEDDDDDDDE